MQKGEKIQQKTQWVLESEGDENKCEEILEMHI